MFRSMALSGVKGTSLSVVSYKAESFSIANSTYRNDAFHNQISCFHSPTWRNSCPFENEVAFMQGLNPHLEAVLSQSCHPPQITRLQTGIALVSRWDAKQQTPWQHSAVTSKALKEMGTGRIFVNLKLNFSKSLLLLLRLKSRRLSDYCWGIQVNAMIPRDHSLVSNAKAQVA